jgi:hypothetical protein
MIVLLDSSAILEILDPPISETGPSDFVEHGSAKQIVALCIGQKPNCPVWQNGTSNFSRKLNFPQFDQKPDACCAKLFATVFSSLETCCIVKSSKRVIISKHLSR